MIFCGISMFRMSIGYEQVHQGYDDITPCCRRVFCHKCLRYRTFLILILVGAFILISSIVAVTLILGQCERWLWIVPAILGIVGTSMMVCASLHTKRCKPKPRGENAP